MQFNWTYAIPRLEERIYFSYKETRTIDCIQHWKSVILFADKLVKFDWTYAIPRLDEMRDCSH